MANELDKTIEELEAEVLGELEEANGQDAPMKSAAPADKIDTSKAEYEDTGAAVVSPDQKDSAAKKIVAKAKQVSGDVAQKSAGKADSMDTPNDGMAKVAKSLAAGDQVDHDGDDLSEMEKMEMAKMTKEMMVNAMYEMMKGKKKTDLQAMYNGMQKATEMADKDMDEESKAKSEAVENRLKTIDVTEHVEALMTGEGDLSEEFKRKAATVFEAAVKSKVRSEVERMEEDYKTELEENINTTKGELTEKVDTYLNYVVEEWMKENELAIERGLKGEIAEDFISGLKQLFEDHYVDVPDEKYDVLEAQSDKISELEAKLNEAIEQSVQMKKSNASLVKEQVVSEFTTDLADTEIEKFKSLIEDVDYSNEESYREKLGTLKESYFPKNAPLVTETIDDVDTGIAQDVDTSGSMQAYMTAIGRTVNSAK
jgi:hypothetical protein